MRFIKVLALVLAVFLMMVFFNQNNAELSQTITLKLDLIFQHWETVPLPFFLLILMAFALGATIVVFFFLFERVRLGAAVRKARKRAAKLEKEVNALRTKALEETPVPMEKVDSEGEAEEEKKAE